MADYKPLTLSDLRQQLAWCARPDFFSRCFHWIVGWFAGWQHRDLRPGLEEQKILDRQIGIIDAMTTEERATPELISYARQYRIAAGSGTRPSEVRQLLETYWQMKRALGEWQFRRDNET